MTSNFLSGKNILVVDDEDDLREIIGEELAGYGARIQFASDSTSAEKLIQKHFFDVIVSDMQMPGGSGVDLIEKLKFEHGKRSVTILITGQTEISPEELYHKGVDAFFTKPYEFGNFLAAIEFLLQNPEKRWSRKFERLPSDFPISVKVGNLSDAIESKAINIGRGGMCMTITNQTPKIGDIIFFSLASSDLFFLEGKGICRWINSENGKTTVGIEFLGLNEQAIKTILDYVREKNPPHYIPKSTSG